ncbi:hypothetical protein ABZP36_032561 [Zizania latifolia]
MSSNGEPQSPVVAGEVKSIVTQVTSEIKYVKLENYRKQPGVESMNNSGINFGQGLPNFTMKKPFAEVVAGHTAKDSEFPALQLKRPLKPGSQRSNLNNEAENKHGSQKLLQHASRLASTMDVTSGGKNNRAMDSSGRNSQQQLLRPRASCLPTNASDHHEKQALFSLGCRVVLPPESFLTMRLPFVFGVETRDGDTVPLKHFEQQPELTAWLVGGTSLQIVSAEHATVK